MTVTEVRHTVGHPNNAAQKPLSNDTGRLLHNSERWTPFRDTRNFSFSHSELVRDASISRKSRSVTIRQFSIHGNVGASFWWRQDVLPNGIREDRETWKPLQRLRTVSAVSLANQI